MKKIMASVLVTLFSLARAANEPCSLTADDSAVFAATLRPLLSANATISFPGSDEFANATVRWSNYGRPTFRVAVGVATEADVQQTVKVANTYSIPFLATAGHHGGIKTLGELDCGVDINLRGLNKLEIQDDGKTAIIEGGILSKEVTDGLWKKGKWTVSGVCDCTSLLGPGLGGGHGWNQGRYGLGLDQFIEVNLVLGDGSMITVSEDSHRDLFWALRGAGHNFGIVTSIRYRIYDVPKDNTWTVVKQIFTQDKLESLFSLYNEWTANQPVELRYWTNFARIPSTDPVNAVFIAYLIYEGTEAQAAPYSDQLLALGPASTLTTPTTYTGLAALTNMGEGQLPCLDTGTNSLRFPIGVRQFNLTAHRIAYEMFNNITATYPALNGSSILNEGYSTKAVQAVPNASTAFPDRFNNLLLSISFRFLPDDELNRIATEAGLAIRQVLLEGSGSSELNTYVNYALGEETLEDWYGHESWRIEKLKALKGRYDPYHRLSLYAPIK